jgi:hypothetical protein
MGSGTDADGSHLRVLLEIDHLLGDLVISPRIKLHSDLLMDQTTRPYSIIDGVPQVRPCQVIGQEVNQELKPDYLIESLQVQWTNERNYLKRNEKPKKSWTRLKRKKRD